MVCVNNWILLGNQFVVHLKEEKTSKFSTET